MARVSLLEDPAVASSPSTAVSVPLLIASPNSGNKPPTASCPLSHSAWPFATTTTSVRLLCGLMTQPAVTTTSAGRSADSDNPLVPVLPRSPTRTAVLASAPHLTACSWLDSSHDLDKSTTSPIVGHLISLAYSICIIFFDSIYMWCMERFGDSHRASYKVVWNSYIASIQRLCDHHLLNWNLAQVAWSHKLLTPRTTPMILIMSCEKINSHTTVAAGFLS